MTKHTNSLDIELVKMLSNIQLNALKWSYMRIEGHLPEEELTANLFADRQLMAAKIEHFLKSKIPKKMKLKDSPYFKSSTAYGYLKGYNAALYDITKALFGETE